MDTGLRSLARILLLVAALCAGQAVPHAAEVEAEADASADDSPAVATDQTELPSPEADSFLQEPAESEELVPFSGSSTSGWEHCGARVGTLILNRSDEQGYDLRDAWPYDYFDKNSSMGRTISDSDFLFPTAAAVDVSLRYPLTLADLDFRYFGILQSTADVGPLSDVFAGHLNTPPAVGQFWSALTSSLQSAELNFRREVMPNVAVLGGFRYVQFRDALLSNQVKTYLGPNGWVDVSTFDLRAQNELFGLQLGAESLLWSYLERLRVEASAKAGIFGNAASSGAFNQLQYRGATSPSHWNAYRGNAAFVGDVAISGSYQLTRRVALRGGYQLLWLSGVATVTEQSVFRTFSAGDVFYHGALVGIEGGW